MITKEETISNGGKAVTVQLGDTTINGTIYTLSGAQINGYRNGPTQDAYIITTDPERPEVYPLSTITLV